jgi:hypothetical protein
MAVQVTRAGCARVGRHRSDPGVGSHDRLDLGSVEVIVGIAGVVEVGFAAEVLANVGFDLGVVSHHPPVVADAVQQGVAAFNRRDYRQASQVFIPLAERGDAAAQTYLGYMFETGRGVPRNYTEAAMWYRRAAEQGDSLAQYSLGLLYDSGFGVPRDIVEAAKWLELSAAGAPPKAREARVRIRDAVTTR